MPDLQKASVMLGGAQLAATSGIVWRFVTGAEPYVTVFTVHRSVWNSKLRNQVGKPIALEITDGRGVKVTVEELYILHEAPPPGPHTVAFVVADKRWLWRYKLIARDFNVPRRTGDKTIKKDIVPEATQTVVNDYDFLRYSLNNGVLWTPKDAVKSILNILEEPTKLKSGKTKNNFIIDSFPIEPKGQQRKGGEFTLQNVMLRDRGDVALSRLLSYIPGASVYVNAAGKVVVFDGADLSAAEKYHDNLPPSTWDGGLAGMIERRAIRPEKVIVYYEREVECVFEFEDDYFPQRTASDPSRDYPYLENVIPTVDQSTTVTGVYNSQSNAYETLNAVPPGIWVPAEAWLRAMDDTRPPISDPWTFATIRQYWAHMDLDGHLGGHGHADVLVEEEKIRTPLRIQALKKHFRQTFRVNRRYMERIRDLRPIRVGLLDPVTGQRAPAAVWGQACLMPTKKGGAMASRHGIEGNAATGLNIDYYPRAPAEIIETDPGPATINLIDKDLGIFSVQWVDSPYGATGSYIPCHLVKLGRTRQVPKMASRDLKNQLTDAMGLGMAAQGRANGIALQETMKMKVMMTIVPSSPNNKRQFHREEVEPADIARVFRSEFRIQGGTGPPLEAYVSPGEATARFAWTVDQTARETIRLLLGLNSDNPDDAGIEGPDLPGFTPVNRERELASHATSLAAELLAPFSDSLQGSVATRVPDKGVELKGNMGGASIRIAGAPSAKVDAVHDFPGQQVPLPRFATMSDAARRVVLGIVTFKG
jgi:hypothetical protein